MRSSLIVIGVLSLVLASCATIATPQEANDAVLVLRKYGSWAWALGIALIWADLVLPILQTAVIAALGIIYGSLIGGLLGSLGLITGGLLGYGLMLTAARRFAQRLAGPSVDVVSGFDGRTLHDAQDLLIAHRPQVGGSRHATRHGVRLLLQQRRHRHVVASPFIGSPPPAVSAEDR